MNSKRHEPYHYTPMQKRRILGKWRKCKGKKGEGIEAVFKWFKEQYPDDRAAQAIKFEAFKQECYRLARKAKKAKHSAADTPGRKDALTAKTAGKRRRKYHIRASRRGKRATFVILVDGNPNPVWRGDHHPKIRVERHEIVTEF